MIQYTRITIRGGGLRESRCGFFLFFSVYLGNYRDCGFGLYSERGLDHTLIQPVSTPKMLAPLHGVKIFRSTEEFASLLGTFVQTVSYLDAHDLTLSVIVLCFVVIIPCIVYGAYIARELRYAPSAYFHIRNRLVVSPDITQKFGITFRTPNYYQGIITPHKVDIRVSIHDKRKTKFGILEMRGREKKGEPFEFEFDKLRLKLKDQEGSYGEGKPFELEGKNAYRSWF